MLRICMCIYIYVTPKTYREHKNGVDTVHEERQIGRPLLLSGQNLIRLALGIGFRGWGSAFWGWVESLGSRAVGPWDFVGFTGACPA